MPTDRWSSVLVALGALCVTASVPAQELPWPMVITREALAADPQSAYLVSVLNLLAREAEGRADDELSSFYFDVLATQLAFVGEHARATQASDEAYGAVAARPNAPEGADPVAGYQALPAIDALVERARDRQLVMINEEHRSSMQRAFANQLLEPLRAIGFTYLAVETLSDDDMPALRTRGYPVHATGTYSRDPLFGDLIRRALALGYTVVAYEPGPDVLRPRPDDLTPIDATNRRERGQAENIFARTLAKDPDAKVLVFGGRDHIAEVRDGQWKPMGGVLADLSGLDPLTIDLFNMVEHSAPEFEHWAFKAVTAAARTADGPVVLLADGGKLWTGKPGVIDISVFHPRTKIEHGRPDWVQMNGMRKAVKLALPAFDHPVLLQAFVAGDGSDAVPLDQVILWPGIPQPALLLRPGAYVVRVVDRDGTERHRTTTRVP